MQTRVAGFLHGAKLLALLSIIYYTSPIMLGKTTVREGDTVSAQSHAKQERIIEALRRNLEGDGAVAFIRESGYAMTKRGLARHLGILGGRESVLQWIELGYSNEQILQKCRPDDAELQARDVPPSQPALFTESEEEAPPSNTIPLERKRRNDFEHTKLTLNLPNELYIALKLAACGENKTRTELVVEILSHALSRMPGLLEEEQVQERMAQNNR